MTIVGPFRPGVSAIVGPLCAAVLLLAGCSSTAGQGRTTQESAMGYTNPVYDQNFADPDVIHVGDTFYAFATNGPLGHIQTLRSADLLHWEQVGDALPQLPSWSEAGKVWAPEVAVHGPQRFLMYYTTDDTLSHRQCVSVAVASKPEGPYVDESKRPLICQEDLGGSIDSSPFVDATGQRYLLWKNDGNAIGVDTWIFAQKLTADGLRLTAEPAKLIKQDLDWEGALVEAPFLVERGGGFHLFYSANAYDKASYAVGHARCESPLGPCTKSSDPILKTTEDAAGPGHCMVIHKDGKDWMVYHAWDPALVGEDPPGRTMWISELTWDDDRPAVHPPTHEMRSAP